jgi:hypothetical protein
MRRRGPVQGIRCDGCGQRVTHSFLRLERWGHFGGWRRYKRFCLECTTVKLAWLDQVLELPWDQSHAS